MLRNQKCLTALTTCSLAVVGSANAAVIQDSSSFTLGVTGTGLAIDTTGLADWGYLTSDFLGGNVQPATNFDSMTTSLGGSTVSSASSTIGAVLIHEDATSNPTTSAPFSGFTFDGTLADGVAGGIGGSEEIFTITFQDLGVGTHTIKLYMDHTNSGRAFDADVFLGGDPEGDGTPDSTVNSGAHGSGAFIYTLVVTASDAGDDVSISIDSTSGSTGAFQFAGYTVATVPEPGSLALIGLGSLCVLRRRRG